MTDREKTNLRGPVSTCIEESLYPGANNSDGAQIVDTTEYDVDGRVMVVRNNISNTSERVIRYTYDAAGHLIQIKTAVGKGGEPTQETNYSYDSRGRQLNITDIRTPDNPITFRYDERGRKTKVQVSRPQDVLLDSVVAGSPFQVADRAPNLPGGGSATTIYDEDDRPTEVQVRDANGQLVNRAMCVYDTQGRVSEEKQIWDSPETMFPADGLDKILEASGASRDELIGHLTKLVGGQGGPFSIAYSYDALGRVTQTRRQIFNQEQVIETSYNEHGDKASEITRSWEMGSGGEGAQGSVLTPYSEVHYTYRYDGYGNWTEKNESYRSSPSGAFESSIERRRSLTYY
jgi:YD repeat-containing protein